MTTRLCSIAISVIVSLTAVGAIMLSASPANADPQYFTQALENATIHSIQTTGSNVTVNCTASGNVVQCSGSKSGSGTWEVAVQISFPPSRPVDAIGYFAIINNASSPSNIVRFWNVNETIPVFHSGGSDVHHSISSQPTIHCHYSTNSHPNLSYLTPYGCDSTKNAGLSGNAATHYSSRVGPNPPGGNGGSGSFEFTIHYYWFMYGEPPALPPSLLSNMVWSAWPECPICSASSAVGWAGGPINTRNGSLSYQETDLLIPVRGESLAFRRSYASGAIDIYTSTLGFGWTHNYAMRLDFENTELPDTVELQAPGGSRLPFFDNGDGTFTPYAGVTAQLTYDDVANEYTVTGFNQMTYHLDSNGRLLQQIDASGNAIAFSYDNDGRLYRAAQDDRFLEYGYDPNDGRLLTVSDNISRTVTLAYDGNGDLVSVTRPVNLTTTYAYSGTTHLLTKVTDPSGRVIEETAYDSEGRAYRQWDGAGNLLVEIDYSLANTHVITENGVVMTHTYDLRGTLVDVTYGCPEDTPGCGAGSDVAYDYHFKARQVIDAAGNATALTWSANGSNLEGVVDALQNSTSLAYDSLNNLTQVVNARGLTTTYSYDNPGFPTFRTQVSDSLGHTTIYTPTAEGLLAAEQDAGGRLTTYAYNDYGQVTEIVRAAGTADAVTTSYGYDGVGRLITTTQTSPAESHTALNVYNDADHLIATIANWTGTDPAAWLNDCDRQGGPRDSNVCTRYEYDEAGRTISTTNTLNQTSLTFYDAAGRVVTSVVNYDGVTPTATLCTGFSNPDPEYNLCSLTGYDEFGRVVTTTDSLGRLSVTAYDPLGRVSRSIANYHDGVFDPQEPDRDVQTLYGYDAVGNSTLITDTTGSMTRTFYDPLNRVAGSLTNWSGSIDHIDDLTGCLALAADRDHDICTLYQYDETGNTVIVTDTLGRMTRTFYDELNRVEATVSNWNPATLSGPGDCVLATGNESDENVCTLFGYDPAGNQVTTTNALNQTNLTVYDAANRPFMTVQNWDGTPIESVGDCSFPPAQADVNVCSVTYFDALGRRSAAKDPLGGLTEFSYDGLGRVMTTTRYLDQLPVTNYSSYDALGNRLSQTDAEENTTTFLYDSLNRLRATVSAEGVAITQTYDAAGRLLATVDNLAHTTTYSYDELDRLLTVSDAESNTTTYQYDGLGNQVAMIDAEEVRTTYLYDGLNRLLGVIENDTGGSPTADSNVLTQYLYDAIGNRLVITNALSYSSTLTSYDALNRPVVVEDALGSRSYSQYNALGYRTVITDANGAVTLFGYDGLNRPLTTTYAADQQVVTYAYDAAGNRTLMSDELGATTYQYDTLNRLMTVTNPFSGTVGYGYDLAGNRSRLVYPDNREVIYTYDGDYRMVQVEDWAEGLTSYAYDAAGRLITTTLPSGVISVNEYDTANRLTRLAHEESGSETLLAEFLYQLDGVGNRVVATETLRVPGPYQMLAERLTSSATAQEQQNPAVAYNSQANQYLVVWQDFRNNQWDVYGQRLDGDGALLGGNFLIRSGGYSPAVAYSSANNGYLVAWEDGEGIWARPVSAAGVPDTAFKVYDGTIFTPASQAAVSYSPAENIFLIAWRYATLPSPVYYHILARSTTLTGQMNSVITATQQTTNVELPRVSADDNGRFLIVWQDSRGRNRAIYGQRLEPEQLVGSNFLISDTANHKQMPDAAWNNTAVAYLVVWQNDQAGISGRRVSGAGDLLGDIIALDNNSESAAPRVTAVGDQWLAVWTQNGDGPGGPIGVVAGRKVAGDGSLPENSLSLSTVFDEVVNAAVAGQQDYLVAWAGIPDSSNSFTTPTADIYSRLGRKSTQLQGNTIQYEYDPLHRLTAATYSGAITAAYTYLYDAVGNMTAFTETIGTEIITATRKFDAANRLEAANDGSGEIGYTYDNNGNLVATGGIGG
jgi:YD repeat-containing protein